jgi:hypothetical protein
MQFLHSAKNAYFYRRIGAINTADVDAYFDGIITAHAGAVDHQRILKRPRKVAGISVRLSFILFSFRQEPTFLRNTARRELRFGFCLLAEIGTHVVAFTRHAPHPSPPLADSLEVVPYGTLSKLFMSNSARYERLSLKTMALSDHTLRGATFEARNLAEALPTFGAHRSIVRSLRVNAAGQVYGITPGTSRVAKTERRSSLNDLVAWAIEVRDHINAFANPQGFIDNFAKPVSLATLPAHVHPSGVLFRLDNLAEAIEDGAAVICNRTAGAAPVELSASQQSALLERSKSAFAVENVGGGYTIVDNRHRVMGTLKKNKATMTIASARLGPLAVRDPLGTVTPFTTFLNDEQDFIVSFTAPQYAYFAGNLFEDTRLLGNVPTFMSVVDGACNFAAVTSEKGNLIAGMNDFQNTSLFHLVETQVAVGADIVICDDLGDEWADHICCWETGEKRLAFYHAKHGAVALGASNFHIVVSQALKNLNRLECSREDVLRKLQQKWGQTIGATNIARIRTGGGQPANQMADRIMAVIAGPTTVKEVGLVVSFISKGALNAALIDLVNGNNNDPEIVQILWLLSAFVTACRAAGARPRIICRP